MLVAQSAVCRLVIKYEKCKSARLGAPWTLKESKKKKQRQTFISDDRSFSSVVTRQTTDISTEKKKKLALVNFGHFVFRSCPTLTLLVGRARATCIFLVKNNLCNRIAIFEWNKPTNDWHRLLVRIFVDFNFLVEHTGFRQNQGKLCACWKWKYHSVSTFTEKAMTAKKSSVQWEWNIVCVKWNVVAKWSHTLVIYWLKKKEKLVFCKKKKLCVMYVSYNLSSHNLMWNMKEGNNYQCSLPQQREKRNCFISDLIWLMCAAHTDFSCLWAELVVDPLFFCATFDLVWFVCFIIATRTRVQQEERLWCISENLKSTWNANHGDFQRIIVENQGIFVQWSTYTYLVLNLNI